MKKYLFFIFLSITFMSCTTPRFISIQPKIYESELNSYEIETLSNLSDYFTVYKVNDDEYAILPIHNSLSSSPVENLEECILLSKEEMKTLKSNLEVFVTKCEKGYNKDGFLAEVKIKEKIITETSNITEFISVNSLSKSVINYAMIIQAYSGNDLFSKKLKYSCTTKSGEINFIELEDVKDLIEALGK